MNNQQKPYLTKIVTLKKRAYNPNFGDDRVCRCGHTYERHFDSYEDMASVGCKYCRCNNFREKLEVK